LDLFSMSGHELRRIEVLSEVLAKRRTEISAAAILGLSTRQMRAAGRGLSRCWWGRHDPQGPWTNLEQPTHRRDSRVRDRAGSITLRGFRPEPGGGGSAYEGRRESLARDTAQVDGRRGSVAVSEAAQKLPPATPQTRELWRVDPDRRQRSSLVRGARSSLFAVSVHR
jgi:hypothetical protein